MFCSNCGTPAQNEQSFCASCGFRLSSQLAPPVTQPVSKGVNLLELNGFTDSSNAPKAMKFIESIKYHFKNYAKFKGRASRSEFWYWFLFCILASYGSIFVVSFVAAILGVEPSAAADLGGAVSVLIAFSLIIPNAAGIARRFHDIDKSGWNFFFVLIPLVGPVLLIVWWCQDGGRDNKYGPAGD